MESELGRMVLLRKLNTNSDESLSSLETESPGQHLCLEISTLKQVGMISISKIMGVSLGKKKERKEAEQRAKVFMFYCFILHLEHKYFKSPLLGDIDFFPVVIYSMSFGVKLVATYLLIFFFNCNVSWPNQLQNWQKENKVLVLLWITFSKDNTVFPCTVA